LPHPFQGGSMATTCHVRPASEVASKATTERSPRRRVTAATASESSKNVGASKSAHHFWQQDGSGAMTCVQVRPPVVVRNRPVVSSKRPASQPYRGRTKRTPVIHGKSCSPDHSLPPSVVREMDALAPVGSTRTSHPCRASTNVGTLSAPALHDDGGMGIRTHFLPPLAVRNRTARAPVQSLAVIHPC
jgi:hypothetical protein